MRGVIASMCDARMVDITHQFPRGDVYTTAFWLREVLPWFPPAVHLVVVDPTVGTQRDVLAIKAGEHVLVGPDNGVLTPVATDIASTYRAYRLEQTDAASLTFHGRDLFAPLAARLHKRERAIEPVEDLVPTEDIVEVTFPEPTIGTQAAVGEILVIDQFGNAITNIPGTAFAEYMGEDVLVNGASVPFVGTYARVERGDPLVTVGSHENVELAVREGRGSDAFDVSVGSQVRISK